MTQRMTWALVALGGLLAFPAVTAAADVSAADLLAKHKAFVGWESGDGSVKTMRSTIHIHDPGADSGENDVVLDEIRKGLLFKQVTRTGGAVYEEGYTGRVFWTTDINANTYTLKNDAVRLGLSETIVQDEGVSVVGGTLKGSEKIDGVETKIVRVSPNGAAPFDVYVDPLTGAFKRVTYFPDDKYERHSDNIASYADVGNGKKVVGSYKYDSNSKRTLAVENIRINEAVRDEELHPPAKTSSWSFNSSAPIPVEEILYNVNGAENFGRAISVRVSIDGHEGRFLLDSGAPDTLVVGSFAATIDSPTIATTSYRTVGFPTKRAQLKLVKEITIGKNVLHNVRVKVSDSAPFGPFDGIIGLAALADAVVDVDLNDKTLRILDPAKFDVTVGKGAYAFDVDMSTLHAAVPAIINGKVAAEPFIDTGNYYGVVLAAALYDSDEVRVTRGALGAPHVNEIQVGPYRYQNVPTEFLNGFGHRGGLLGYDFLKHFNWTFDLPQSKIVLTPNGR